MVAPFTKRDREAVMFNLTASPPLPDGPQRLLVLRYEATVAALEARCESVANDLCTYVAMNDTDEPLQQFLFHRADILRRDFTANQPTE